MGAGLTAEHWDAVHGGTDPSQTSWYQALPVTSLRLVHEACPPPAHVADVGGGTSLLADHLLATGYEVTVLDVSERAMEVVRSRLGSTARTVVSDVLAWEPAAPVDVWHDRAVFHFLVEPSDRTRYAELAEATVSPGGALVLGTFAMDGPEQCSGLPTSRYDETTLAACFASAFALERAEREQHRTPWGAVQPFTWVVLRRR